MSRNYEMDHEGAPRLGGSFMKAIRLVILEMACLGERRFEVSGYPHVSLVDALSDDWAAIGQDFRSALQRIEKSDVEPFDATNSGSSKQDGRTARSEHKVA